MSTVGNTTQSPAGAIAASGLPKSQIASNFNDFLKLLTTQLQNQDPTNPLDTNEFTNQLVQFASVEQQINQNTNLEQLISLTQGQQMMQASQMMGAQVVMDSDKVIVQNGSAGLKFEATSTMPVMISVMDQAGRTIHTGTYTPQVGSNVWGWDGTTATGAQARDGEYSVSVMQADAAGQMHALDYGVIGTVTGAERSGNGMNVRIGNVTVDMSKITSLL